jgi:hypothetical protein
MRELILPVTTIAYSDKLSDQFSVDENTNEVTLMFVYVKDKEAGVNITIERADYADDVWSTISGQATIGTGALVPYTLQLSASSSRAFTLPTKTYGFYRIRFISQDSVATYGTLTAYVIKDK